MIDFDLEYPLEKILTNMLDKVEGHAVGCKCIDCNSLEVLAFMIMEKPEVIEFEEDR
jgi:hypothetical protein